ncbi:MAG: F0F1 ATP synthase subunit B [Pseudomonadota bacterium]
MNINLTLLGQMITFALFVWFTMKYVWPPMMKALAERQKKIADGLAAAEQSQRDLELAELKSLEIIRESKEGASHIIEAANKRAEVIIEEAKEAARVDGQRIVAHAQDQVNQAVVKAKEELRSQVGQLAVATAEKILRQTIDASKHQELIAQAVKTI